MNEPVIEIKFGNCTQTHEQIRSLYVKSFRDAIHAARGDQNALNELRRLVVVAQWELDHFISEAYLQQHKAA